MLPTLIYDAVILYANSILQIITSMGYSRQDQSCNVVSEPWILGTEVVKLMKVVCSQPIEYQ